eukprot:355086-Chlamydomonas_euryale.AAC.10
MSTWLHCLRTHAAQSVDLRRGLRAPSPFLAVQSTSRHNPWTLVPCAAGTCLRSRWCLGAWSVQTCVTACCSTIWTAAGSWSRAPHPPRAGSHSRCVQVVRVWGGGRKGDLALPRHETPISCWLASQGASHAVHARFCGSQPGEGLEDSGARG